MLPSLFNGIKDFKLKCKVCVLAKSLCTSFSSNMNKKLFPFALVHSDVWGLPLLVLIFGIKWLVTFVMIAPVCIEK